MNGLHETTDGARRGERLFNAGWRFSRGDADASAPEFDDAGWRDVELPHDWSIEGPFDESLTSATAYLPGGIGWYRRGFTLADAGFGPGMRLRIRFDGVYNNSTVWCNGKLLGTRPYGYSSFSYDLTDSIDASRAEQVIAVRVDHSEFSDSRWYTGSGIYRNVWLTASDPIHVIENGVWVETPRIEREAAAVRAETTVRNETDAPARVLLTSVVLDPSGREVARLSSRRTIDAGTTARFAQTTRVDFPELWGIDYPSLYRLVTIVSRERSSQHASAPDSSAEPVEWINGIPVSASQRSVDTLDRKLDDSLILDTARTTFGIRSFSFDPQSGFELNGTPMKLKGVCVHHDAGCFGAAVPKAVWARRFRILKQTGCNAIRFSHNPPAPEVLDLCDELGLLAMDEAFDEWEDTKNKWVFGHNKGEPSRQGYGTHFTEWNEADLAAMVVRDRNHPSIILWSIGNEIDYPNDPFTHPILGERYRTDRPHSDRLGVIAGRLAGIVRSLDPTRPVTAALADVTISNRTGFADALDVAGYNYLERHYEADHAAYPSRVIYGSENSQSLEAWIAVRDHRWVSGQFLWTGIDFLGEAHGWPVRNSQAGYLDTAGFRKPRAYFRQSLWTSAPMVRIGVLPPEKEGEPAWRRIYGETRNWNRNESGVVTVVCHTNCDTVELVQDDKLLGTRKATAACEALQWDIPYTRGRLVAKAYRDGELVATDELASAGKPARIAARVGKDAGDERSFLRADGVDLMHVELTIVDADGTPIPDAGMEISVTVSGPARVIGLENGDPASHESYGTAHRRAFQGRLLAVVRSTGDAGTATLRLAGEGLEPLELPIACV